ncbi:MAG: hypothetical protein P8Y13_06190 [Deinococcales bacterium]|jgi:hypothetical protein
MTEGETRRQEAEIGRSMRRVSRGLSAFALTLMIVGLVLALTTAPRPLDPRALDLSARGQRLMLGGVVVLCLLPAVRVLTAGAHYAAARRLAQAVVALVVLLELISSIVTGG